MPNDDKLKSGISVNSVKPMAAVIYAAAADQDTKMKHYVASTMVNRWKSGKKEFGADTGSMLDVINKEGQYYETKSKLYEDFMNNKFPNEDAKMNGMESMSIASAMMRGSLEPMPGEFWFSEDEKNKLIKKKSFDFKKVKSLGKIGKDNKFEMFSY